MVSAFQDATWQAIGWSALVFLVGFIFGRRTGGGRDLSGPPKTRSSPPAHHRRRTSHAPPQANLDPELRAEIEAMLGSGKKIEAIKLLREATGMGLKESKEAIEEGRF